MDIYSQSLKKVLVVLYISFAVFFIIAIFTFQLEDAQQIGNDTGLKRLLVLPLFLILSFFLIKPSLIISAKLGKRLAEKDTKFIDSIPKKRLGIWIFFAAGLSLFAELAIIRLHASYFPLFGFYKNFSLLSSFLGLGIGYARAKNKLLITFFALPLLAIQIVFIDAVNVTKAQYLLLNPIPENITMGLAQVGDVGHVIFVYFFLAIIFAFNALFFIPLGQLAGRLMIKREGLWAYGWNLIGSIFGIFLFSVISYAWMPPSIWLLAISFFIIIFIHKNLSSIVISFLSLGIIMLFLITPQKIEQVDIYSPYQILTLNFGQKITTLSANKTYFQRIADFREENIGDDEYLQSWATYYDTPYFFKPNPQDVLIVGSGAGNDVAAAIRNNASRIDAVEIDPAILEIGTRLHPEKPYDSTKVKSIVADARTFIRQTDRKYDLIVYGVLDSHSLLSGKSSIRLDSFVYTVEAFKEARERLKENGIIVLSFATKNEVLSRKLYLMFEEAFNGQPPIVYETIWPTFIAGENIGGKNFNISENLKNITENLARSEVITDKATDDWPFFYMPIRKFPASYIPLVGILIAVSFALIHRFAKSTSYGFSVPGFFLGAGFMLIEAKGITELALFYGSTWFVTSIVVTIILLFAFFANWIISKVKKLSLNLIYVMLFLSLFVGLGVSYSGLIISTAVSKTVVTFIILGPIFFSGLAFSSEIRRFKVVSAVIFSNLLGAMVGGFLEYNSMYFGIRFLYILAMFLYIFAFITARRAAK